MSIPDVFPAVPADITPVVAVRALVRLEIPMCMHVPLMLPHMVRRRPRERAVLTLIQRLLVLPHDVVFEVAHGHECVWALGAGEAAVLVVVGHVLLEAVRGGGAVAAHSAHLQAVGVPVHCHAVRVELVVCK